MSRARKSSETICPDRFCRPPEGGGVTNRSKDKERVEQTERREEKRKRRRSDEEGQQIKKQEVSEVKSKQIKHPTEKSPAGA